VHKTVVGAKVTDSKQAQKKAAVFEPNVQMSLKKLTSYLVN
jgi:Ca2+-binding EF-hand superfamily protein